MTATTVCRSCSSSELVSVLDLGHSPPANDFLSEGQLSSPEVSYPLALDFCENCGLLQTRDYLAAEAVFRSDYAYFSSTSSSWLAHAREFAADAIAQWSLDSNSFVLEIASNDGYLLKNFVQNHIPCLGIEPTKSVADAAEANGVPTLVEFFGDDLATSLLEKFPKADLVVANNVLAHVPDLVDFVLGIRRILKETGVISIEVPHLRNLVELGLFDTVYHEHFSYFTLHTLRHLFSRQGLKIFDVDLLETHGGSLRVWATHSRNNEVPISPEVEELIELEKSILLHTVNPYMKLQERAEKYRDIFLSFLVDNRRNQKTVVGFGAAAKANTLLNFCGIRSHLIEAIYDNSPGKVGRFTPGSHIPVRAHANLGELVPDVIIIFPWNLTGEILEIITTQSGSRAEVYRTMPALERLA